MKLAAEYRKTRILTLHQWHAETVDADVIGYTGPQTRPRALAVRLPNGRTALTQTLSAPLAAQIAQVLVAAGPAKQGRTDTSETYTKIPAGLAVVEVLAGTTRHAVVTPPRRRDPAAPSMSADEVQSGAHGIKAAFDESSP